MRERETGRSIRSLFFCCVSLTQIKILKERAEVRVRHVESREESIDPVLSVNKGYLSGERDDANSKAGVCAKSGECS